MERRVSLVVAFAAITLLAVALIALVLQPTPEDGPLFAVLLGIPLAIAVFAALVAQRWGWHRRFRSLFYALFAAYALGAGIILLTVLVTARLMFISSHDASLAAVIVVYASLLTLAFGYFVTQGLSEGIGSITRAAERVEQGDLSARAEYGGNDEIAQLAGAFNTMTTKLRAARDQEARLNQARRDLIAWVSHDLRTPLTGIRARAEALSDGVVTDSRDVSRYLNAMYADTQAMSHLIDDLFEIATIDAGGLRLDPMDVALSDLVSDTIESQRILAEGKGVALSGRVAPDVDPVRVSPQHIQRVLTNLVGNALAHTRAGRVDVSATREPDGAVRVCVEDTGEGIAPEDLPRVFERFYRGDSSRKRDESGRAGGMGLGLVIASAIIEAHGGSIGIDSALGAGTRVWFTVPAR